MTKRITVYVSMSAISNSSQELVLEGDDIPEGWDGMTDDQKDSAMGPRVQAAIDNEITAGWYEA
jgi:hypothetical protein